MTVKKDYTGKIVYMGIDVHKKTYACVSVCEGNVVKRDTMPARSEALLHYVNRFFAGATIKSAYEAGFSGFHLHRFLIDNGVDNIVVHPGSIEVASRDRVKNDKRDALKIALQLSNHRLRGIFVPSVEQEARRQVSRLRTHMWKARQRVGMQLKSLLFTQGLLDIHEDKRISQKWLNRKLEAIEKGPYPKDFYYSAKHYADEWTSLTKRLKEIERQLKVQAASDKDLHSIYESVPDIGLVYGRELANELGDMRQFKNEKCLFSYTGLTPSEHSSGDHVRHGHISRQGRSVLRKILIEASWIAITKDPSLYDVYKRLSHRGCKRAIVAVARHLAGRIRSCVLNGVLYEIKGTLDSNVRSMIGATS